MRSIDGPDGHSLMICRICQYDTVRIVGQVEGYQRGHRFDVLECAVCGTSVANPCRGDPDLYDAIYRNVENVPGYSRYFQLAAELLEVPDPLEYIAAREDCYYAITKVLRETVADKSQTKLCEVGCGQGYLTYALTRAGFDCTGVDISENAIQRARQRYGDHYFCGTVADFGRLKSAPDIVLATELIEHMEDPVEFIDSVMGSLSDQGIFLLTTPNKSPLMHGIWDTELPPVHLWWFTKGGVAAMGARTNCKVEFVDLADFYQSNTHYPLVQQIRAVDRTPVFSENYELIDVKRGTTLVAMGKRHLKRNLPAPVVRVIQRRNIGAGSRDRISEAELPTIAAIFSKQA
jgi:SAM-dependent methyltransferase